MKKILFLAVWCALLPLSADAASLHIIAPESVNVREPFAVEVFLDTEGENINAIEGSLMLPLGVSVSEVRYQGSIVSLWLSSPAVRSPRHVDFAGVIPAGYQGSPEKTGRGNMFTLLVVAQETGDARFSFESDVKAYRNDGEGTALPLSKGTRTVSVVTSGAPVSTGVQEDVYPPESFIPEVVSGTPYGMDGDALVFNAQDKDSGIERYDVAFSIVGYMPYPFLSWTNTESPFLIPQSERGKYMFVRATDKAGNIRIATLEPLTFSRITFVGTWGLPLLIAVLIAYFGVRFLRRKVSLR